MRSQTETPKRSRTEGPVEDCSCPSSTVQGFTTVRGPSHRIRATRLSDPEEQVEILKGELQGCSGDVRSDVGSCRGVSWGRFMGRRRVLGLGKS